MQINKLDNFYLVGGTALALHLGHRISIDLDLFTHEEFDTQNVRQIIQNELQITNISEQKNTLSFSAVYPKGTANQIKVDLIRFAYPLIHPMQKIDEIRLAAIEDIAPMKLSAAGTRGSKKDFFDIYFLLKHYTLKEMFQLFEKKFQDGNKLHIVKSLTYFDDAEPEPNPIMLQQASWETVKQSLRIHTKSYMQQMNIK